LRLFLWLFGGLSASNLKNCQNSLPKGDKAPLQRPFSGGTA